MWGVFVLFFLLLLFFLKSIYVEKRSSGQAQMDKCESLSFKYDSGNDFGEDMGYKQVSEEPFFWW